jgi:hypothetical protein
MNSSRHELLESVRWRRKWAERLAAIVLAGIPTYAVAQIQNDAVLGLLAIIGGVAGHLSYSAGTNFERAMLLRSGKSLE